MKTTKKIKTFITSEISVVINHNTGKIHIANHDEKYIDSNTICNIPLNMENCSREIMEDDCLDYKKMCVTCKKIYDKLEIMRNI